MFVSTLFKQLCGKTSVSRMRRMMRAGRALLASPAPFKHHEFIHDIEQIPLGIPQRAWRKTIPEALQPATHHALRQKLLQLELFRSWLPQLMLHLWNPSAAITLAMPPSWRDRLGERGIQVAAGSCRRRWLLLQLRCLGAGMRTWVKLFARSLETQPPGGPDMAVLIYLTNLNVPKPAARSSVDFVSWFRKTLASRLGCRSIWAHIPGRRYEKFADNLAVVPHFFPPLPGFASSVAFALQGCAIVTRATMRTLAGAWWEALLLEQALEIAYFNRLPSSDIARAYVFNASAIFMRPLWTYAAAERGSAISNVCYSANLEQWFPDADRRVGYQAGLPAVTWPTIYVWDEAMARALADGGIGKETLQSVGPVDFIDSGDPLDMDLSNAIAVFDVPPIRPSVAAEAGIPNAYYTDAIVDRFVLDVVAASHAAGLEVAFKRKRAATNRQPRGYRSRSNQLVSCRGVHLIDPNIGARRLIGSCLAAVSLPFTSAALVAQADRRPSVYYDPTGKLGGHAKYAHGIQVLCGVAELRNWLAFVAAEQRMSGRASR